MTPAQLQLLHDIAEGQSGCRRGVILVLGSARIQMARRMVTLGWLTERKACFTGGIYFEITRRGRSEIALIYSTDY